MNEFTASQSCQLPLSSRNVSYGNTHKLYLFFDFFGGEGGLNPLNHKAQKHFFIIGKNVRNNMIHFHDLSGLNTNKPLYSFVTLR